MKSDFRPPDLCSTVLPLFYVWVCFFFTETLLQMQDDVKPPVLGAEIEIHLYTWGKTSGMCADI